MGEGAILAADLISLAINTIVRVEAARTKAALENRTINLADLKELQVEIDAKRAEWQKLTE